MAAMAADVVAVLAAEGVEQAALVGLSLGGCVALQTALAAPERVSSLVLINTFAKLRSNGMRWSRLVRLRRALGDADGLARLVAASLFDDPEAQALVFERLRRNDVGAIRRTMWAVARFDVRRRLGRVTAPVLVLTGDRDRTVPRLCTADLVAALPAARLQTIPDSGHALPYDQPEAFAAAVRGFLRHPHHN
jgi:pimeloyl-ACP methyl ester carboxylesterase